MGSLSQTKYYLSALASTTTITRRRHPLQGQKLELLSESKTTVVVRLWDGSSLKIPRRWTDLDAVACTELAGDSQFCLQGLRELLSLVKSLRQRACIESRLADEKITHAHPNVEAVDGQAEKVGVCRARGSRGTVGESSRASEARSHGALCEIDGSCIGAAAGHRARHHS